MSLSTIFSFKKRSLKLTEPTTTLKGQYLGNVSTNVAKGEKCIDRPLALLWSNYVKTSGKQTIAMKITVDNSGLKVHTTSQGLTHYWCHRISHFCVAMTTNPKLFVWIYRHAGKRLKVELRCHAILLTNERKAKDLVELLTDKVAASLQEYRREKTLKHRRRLLDQKAAAYLTQHGESPGQARTKLLATSKNYKPPTEYSLATPTLTAISEEAACSSSEESDYNTGSPYSTLGRWTFKNKFNDSANAPTTPDVNMNQLPDDGECSDDPLNDYSSVSGFATMPRRQRPSNRKLQKRLLVDRLETLVMQNTEDSPPTQRADAADALDAAASGCSEDGCEVEPGSGSDEEDDEDSGAGSQSLSGAEASPVNPRCVSMARTLHSGQSDSTGTLSYSDRLSEECANCDTIDSSLSVDNIEHDLLGQKFPKYPSIAHIRSFSDDFYSFDTSSLSSDCSDASLEQQRVCPQSAASHSSSCKGDVSTELDGGLDDAAADLNLVIVGSPYLSEMTKKLNNLTLQSNNERSKILFSSQSMSNQMIWDFPDNAKCTQLNGNTCHSCQNGDTCHGYNKFVRSDTQGERGCCNAYSNGATMLCADDRLSEHDTVDSDASDDSSIQIIRMITRL